MKRFCGALAVAACVPWLAAVGEEGPETASRERPIAVGGKAFNEGYILGEIVAQALEAEGFPVERRLGLGGTLICYEALVSGEIDVYVEYTGTLARAILQRQDSPDLEALNQAVTGAGLELLAPFGFNNAFALAIRRALAERRGIRAISDLAGHNDLRVALSHEFLQREDGWPGLAHAYGLKVIPTGIEHALAYQALNDGAADLMDAYTTDGELLRRNLAVLRDDRGYFPRYLAAPLVRQDLPSAAKAALRALGNTLNDQQMQAMNRQALEGGGFDAIAQEYLASLGIGPGLTQPPGFDGVYYAPGGGSWRTLGRNALRHLELTAMALLPAAAVGIALSFAVFRVAWLSRAVVYAAGLLQTIPSIALLALMIPLFGIGVAPAIVALFLYSLLPIVRNTVTALVTIDPVLLRVCQAMGLTPRQALRHVLAPLAVPSMLAGVRTAAVISIGTATLAAFIGAGGLGDPIVTGLALNDVGLILQGALPAAALAVLAELAFEGLERLLSPRHLAMARD